ncbi:MAG: hypothetical protein ISS16_05260 [Ignavibacteria bacterium]|nr:hypothetical protein [Ignavibacteria bacterium]
MEIKETKNIEYVSLLLSRVKSDLFKNSETEILHEVNSFIDKLRESENILKNVYLISRVEGLESLGSYLLYVFKKVESGRVNFDNLTQNLLTDKTFIEKELKNYFGLYKEVVNPVEEKITEKKDEKTIQKEEESTIIRKNIKGLIEDNQFKVGELDNELVTEEFNESDFMELVGADRAEDKKDYLEFVQIDDESKEEIVFNLPDDIKDISELLQEEGEKIDREKKRIIDAETETKEAEQIEDETEIKPVFEEHTTVFEEVNEEQKKVDKLEEHTDTTEHYEEPEEEEITEEEPETQLIETDKHKEIEKQVPSDTYIKYESELILRNSIINDGLEQLLRHLKEDSEDKEQFEYLIINISEDSSYMVDYSREMAFDVIASLYETIMISFKSAGVKEFEVTEDSVFLFREAIQLIESLIHGYEYEDYEKVIHGFEKVRRSIIENRKEKENLKKIKEEKTELEKRMSIKYQDAPSREQLIKLKHNILEVEKIFRSLEEIEGDYQIYEALRRLSGTFSHLKEIVNISKILKLEQMAKLSEANYIFVKFLQNYRLDPFDKEIKEILKYMVYNFKLIFLDKSTRDLDLFISYLNDPVKIFEQNKKPKI